MANTNITSRSPFAQSFFLAKRYNPPLPAQFCASRQPFHSLNSPDSIGLMETLCAFVVYQPTYFKPDPEKMRFMCAALSIEIQHCLVLLGASTKDTEKRLLLCAFSP